MSTSIKAKQTLAFSFPLRIWFHLSSVSPPPLARPTHSLQHVHTDSVRQSVSHNLLTHKQKNPDCGWWHYEHIYLCLSVCPSKSKYIWLCCGTTAAAVASVSAWPLPRPPYPRWSQKGRQRSRRSCCRCCSRNWVRASWSRSVRLSVWWAAGLAEHWLVALCLCTAL